MDFFNLAAMMAVSDSDVSGLSTIASKIFDYAAIILIPVMIVVGVAGIFYSIYLGVNLAKADSADKRQEAKSRMINAIIGFVAIFVLILLMYLFCDNVDTLFGWTREQHWNDSVMIGL